MRKPQTKEYFANYREKNKEKKKQYDRIYNSKNLDKRRQYKLANKQRIKEVAMRWWAKKRLDNLLKAGGKCPICC